MQLDQFDMERMQSTYENLVEFNLSESGVHPMRLEELLDDPADRDAVFGQELGYTQSNGTLELRRAIASLYRGATVDHIEVTNGGSEANFIATWHLVDPKDEVVMMVPNYMQTFGLVKAFGGTVHPWPLVERGGRWRVDLDHLASLVSERTRLIIICNPNNPTGSRLSADELNQICGIATKHGSWILSDEIYRGAELDGVETASIWGRYERAIITSGLSKAYGLPGLRIGWIVAPEPTVAGLWSYHDYTTIAPGALSDRLARIALVPARRTRILARTRAILRANLPIITEWLSGRGDTFSFAPPEAGAIIYVRYRTPINSLELVTQLRRSKSVLVVPGDHFGMDRYLRIGFGAETAYLKQGLARLHELVSALGTETVGS
ncbi:MAG: aminotransferase class I/II-fold pyridoxal phosphate-dependent enzyme [Acidobacteria bacterium]|nr:aminotransferase class I/II-fold pyridoxal phosphate-dependent enzyme [Acidobacteriota bacterium]